METEVVYDCIEKAFEHSSLVMGEMGHVIFEKLTFKNCKVSQTKRRFLSELLELTLVAYN